MKNISLSKQMKNDLLTDLNHARIESIDRIKGRVSLSMRNGLVSTGTYLYDLNDLKEGMTVLVGKLDGSYVIIEKVTGGTKKSAATTVPIAYSDKIYGSAGIDVCDGLVYVSDHYGCAVKVYGENTGILVATLDATMGQPKSPTFYLGDIKVRDGKGYITFPYSSQEITMSAEMIFDGVNININMESIHYYHSSYTAYPSCIALNDDYLFVSSVGGPYISIYTRDVTSHSGDDRVFKDTDSNTRIPLGMYCLDNNRYAQMLVAVPLFGEIDYSFSGVYLYDLSTESSIRKYGVSGVGPTDITSATFVWLYDNKIYVTDGIVSSGPFDYKPVAYPKVLVFDYATGELIRTFGSRGTGSGQFICPTGICVHNDIVYVNDVSLAKTLRFTTEGLFLGDLTD